MSSKIYNGLTDAEVKHNRVAFGSNIIGPERDYRVWEVIKEIISEPLFIILVCASLVYFLLGESGEGTIMLIALGLVSGISLFQENRSRTAVTQLKKLNSPDASVIRNGTRIKIPTDEIVMQDIIVLEDGNIIPADAELLETHDFSVNESILTGEALPVIKDAGEKSQRIFQGTMVMTGSCIARVVATGKETKLGKIGRTMLEIEVTKTPLQEQIRSFVRSMVWFGAMAFLVVWLMNYFSTGKILHSLLSGLTLAMSVLPEEIPVAFSTFMALGAYHLYKKKVIARTPHTVETLGAATVICIDKTGTITENEMKLAGIFEWRNGKLHDYSTEPVERNAVLEYAMWASETNPFDPMEKAIHEAYERASGNDRREQYSVIHEYPLSGIPPIMTHVYCENETNEPLIAVKGGLETIIKQSRMAQSEQSLLMEMAARFATKGCRVLGVGKGINNTGNLPLHQHDLIFECIGLIAFYDPPKANMEIVIQQFYQAGMEVKMITGDYPETAMAIASQVRIRNCQTIMTGDEVMKLDEATLCSRIKNASIFARMFPDAKLRVIESLKKNGEVVAMTGDGVNDGPALKAAHIGIAMGKRGSEIAKKAAALILVDDDLSHMVDAIALGRRIYENLKKAIQYIISIHIPIILIVTLPLLFFWKFTDFFSPIHVIFLELIMGPTCSIIFENEPIEPHSMNRKPRKMTITFFSFQELSVSIIQGLGITLACLGTGWYYIQLGEDLTTVRTIIYTTLILSNLFLTLVNRSFFYSILTTMRYKNRLIPVILLVSIIVLLLSLYVDPVRNLFSFGTISALQISTCIGTAFTGVLWIEGYKYFKRNRPVIPL